MTEMDDEAMKAMVRRCIEKAYGNDVADQLPAASRAVLFAIIETRDRDAALVEKLAGHLHLGSLERLSHLDTAAAIRSGQQFRKDV